jgi:hypothetical protein
VGREVQRLRRTAGAKLGRVILKFMFSILSAQPLVPPHENTTPICT